MLPFRSMYVIHTLSSVTAGGVRDGTASGSEIYMGFFVGALEQEDREDHQRRCLQHNPDVQGTGIHLKTKSIGGSHEEVRCKWVGMDHTRATCQGYGS